MNLPPCVLACPATLALILRAKITGELPNTSYDAAWDALDAPEAYQPAQDVQDWVRANWHGPIFGAEPQPEQAEVLDISTVSRRLARTWMPKFLEVFIATGGNASEASRQSGIEYSTPYKSRERDPVFAEAWEWAERKVADAIRGEIYRRAVEGWDEPQFGMLPGKGAGEGVVGAVRKFDSPLLIKMATARVPEYRTLVKEGAAQVQATATANVNVDTTLKVSTKQLERIQERTKKKFQHQVDRARVGLPENN